MVLASKWGIRSLFSKWWYINCACTQILLWNISTIYLWLSCFSHKTTLFFFCLLRLLRASDTLLMLNQKSKSKLQNKLLMLLLLSSCTTLKITSESHMKIRINRIRVEIKCIPDIWGSRSLCITQLARENWLKSVSNRFHEDITWRGRGAADTLEGGKSPSGSDPFTTLRRRDTHWGVLREQHMTGDTAIPRIKPSLAQSLCCCATKISSLWPLRGKSIKNEMSVYFINNYLVKLGKPNTILSSFPLNTTQENVRVDIWTDEMEENVLNNSIKSRKCFANFSLAVSLNLTKHSV